MEDELLELNISYNEFDEEVGLDLENELLGGEEISSKTEITSCKNVESDTMQNDSLNSSSLKDKVVEYCFENENIKERNDSLMDLRERLNSRSNQNSNTNELTSSESFDSSLDINVDIDSGDNELSIGKRRKTGVDNESRTEFDKEMCSDYEEEEKMEVQTGTKRKRGGRKKRKRKKEERPPVDTGIGCLLRPLDIKKCKTWRELAREIIFRLNEPKKRLIYKVVEVIGVEEAWSLFKETVRAQKSGGLWTHNGTRRRSNGGVFLHLLKVREYATEEQLTEIFKEENEIAKQNKKSEQDKMSNEVDDDLRKILQDKKSELLATEIGKASLI